MFELRQELDIMPRPKLSLGRFSGFALALPLVLGACAEERPPINRVQANALEKSFFVGKSLSNPNDDPEFYSAATVIDVPYGVDHGLFSGMAGGLKRLKWEITEDKLIARATYETYNGADGRGSRRTNDGQVIAAFPIVSHFDIRRAYNPSTGEELNVVEENTSDRPWNERKFFRVDWSINLVTSSIWWDPLSQNTLGGVNYGVEPLSYYVNDPANPDAPVFSVGEGYFDVTQKVYVTPKELTLDGQTFPTCLWRGVLVMSGRAEEGTCESSEIKVRMSFLRVKSPGERGYQEYEPLHWDGARMDAFGIFTQDRKGYDNHYGVVDEAWYRFAQRYNIWEESFAKDESGAIIGCGADGAYDPAADPTRDENNDGTDDECANQNAPAGSQCNPIARACTLPYARREVHTVPWHHHMSNENEVIVEQSQLATEEWDAAMRMAVQAARQAECRRTRGESTRRSPFANKFAENNSGDPVAACDATFPVDQREEAELENVRALNRCWFDKGRGSPDCEPPSSVAAIKPVIAFCHNPVRAKDDRACGEKGLETRPGDIRYHSINIWPTPEDSSPWGFGPSWADPLTGEIIQASINVYNAVTDERAQRIVDKARWFAGEIATPEILSGQYVRDRIRQESTAEGSRQFLMSKADIDRRLLGMLDVDASKLENAATLRAALNPMLGANALKNELGPGFAAPPVGGANSATFAARMDAVKGSPLEAQLVGPMWFDSRGVDPAATNASALEMVSPLRRANARRTLEVQEAVQRRLAQNGMCLYEADAPEPSSMPALGKLFERKFGIFDRGASAADQATRANRMWNYVRGKMHYGVLLHEMGHTIGERHNFTSSFDKFNYRPQYWQLRAKVSGQDPTGVATECLDSSTDATGENCVGPRYYDPLTPEEVDNSLYTWAQTTVMDYSGELTHDWLGLGIYDYAAARMFYGDVVDVRKDLSCPAATGCPSPPTDRAANAHDFVDYPGYLIPQTVDVGTDMVDTLHYSMWNAYFKLVEECHEATQADLTPPPDWDARRYGEWDPVFDGEIVKNEVCSRPPVTYYSWRELQPDLATDASYIRDPQYYSPRRAHTKDDGSGRAYVRVPYSFASDEFRDGWSPSILTRDAGADVYEQTLWFINQYENGHVWNNFRNGRSGFSIVNAYMSELSRFHMKLSNFAQALSIIHDYYSSEIAKNFGVSHSEVLGIYEGDGGFMREQAVASGAIFDHFVRVLTRPQPGLHFSMPGSDGMYLAEFDRIGANPQPRAVQFSIPNGTTFAGQDLTFGGRPLNNGYEFGQGYWYFDYINQAGSYYEKTYAFDMMLNATYRAPYAFTRWDGIDGRWQFTNFVNLFPDGMRRLVGSMLTEDWALFAPRITADQSNRPELTQGNTPLDRYPLNPIGWASFVAKDGPEHCFPTAGNYLCRDSMSEAILRGTPPGSVAVEPQLGFEIQKFLAFWAYVYMPDSQVLDFVDMMRLWKLGEDIDPAVAGDFVGWVDPETNIRYYARRFGDELIFGKPYDKGIASKMLQWANHLTCLAYENTDNGDGTCTLTLDADGRPVVADDNITIASNMPRLCSDNRYCQQLRDYRGLVDFVRDLGHQVGFIEPELPTIER